MKKRQVLVAAMAASIVAPTVVGSVVNAEGQKTIVPIQAYDEKDYSPLENFHFSLWNEDGTKKILDSYFGDTELEGYKIEQFDISSLNIGERYLLKLATINKGYKLNPTRVKVGTDIEGKKVLFFEEANGISGDNDKVEMVVLTQSNEHEEEIPSVNEEISEINVRITKNGAPEKGVSVGLVEFEVNKAGHVIPNLISRVDTDNDGISKFGKFKPVTKYELRVGSSNSKLKYDYDLIRFETDNKGNINQIFNSELAKDFKGTVNLKAYDMKDDNLEKVDFTIKTVLPDGSPAEGVVITANTMVPQLRSYKNFTSNEKGEVKISLEGQEGGRDYSLCVAKNDQFNWEFKPESIEVSVEKDKVVYNDGNKDQNVQRVFEVTKVNKHYLKDALKAKIAEGKELLASKDYVESSKTKLRNAVKSAEEELAKEETIPTYVEGFTKDIEAGIKALVKVEKPANPSIVKDRISGKNRIMTSVELSKKKFETADTVVLASANNFADALSASILAGQSKSPILLTNKGTVSSEVKEEIARLKATKVIVVGGEGSVSKNAINSLDKKLKIEVLSGKNRYETSRKISEKVLEKSKDAAIIVDGRNYPDALSASTIATKYQGPILLVDNSKEGMKNIDFIKSKNVSNFIILGGENSVSKNIEAQLKNATRIAGANRYQTSILAAFETLGKNTPVYVATGKNYADAMMSGPVVINEKSALILIDNASGDFYKMKTEQNIPKVTAIGGTNSISEELLSELVKTK